MVAARRSARIPSHTHAAVSNAISLEGPAWGGGDDANELMNEQFWGCNYSLRDNSERVCEM